MNNKIEKMSIKERVLHTSAKLFFEKGYQESTLREIANKSGVNYGSLTFAFKNKENILSMLIAKVFEYQFEMTDKYLKGATEDKILYYAFETTLQLHLAESSEHMREMYNVSYSLNNPSLEVFRTISSKLEYIFKDHLPHLEKKDFYELEIASAGIMRNFITVPCDVYFTMERKVRRFLETTFLIFRVEEKKIKEAIDFVLKFDFEKIANEVLDKFLESLESKID
ncbi:MAG: TetR/AcrR family transcriptional regulator [Bacilli bacterium]|nr:TetR/AcrR family transcriptional regulator [Bacilli bacterium]